MADRDDETTKPPAQERSGLFDEWYMRQFARKGQPARSMNTAAEELERERARRESNRDSWSQAIIAQPELDERIQPLIDKCVKELLAELVVKPLNEVREALKLGSPKYGIKMLDDVVTALENASKEKK